ncbi:MAG: hypothetical protein K2W96_11245 [Gemmataceae bacterium]|nr:hypothetical protein [Gemmataceae bacterium]
MPVTRALHFRWHPLALASLALVASGCGQREAELRSMEKRLKGNVGRYGKHGPELDGSTGSTRSGHGRRRSGGRCSRSGRGWRTAR